MINNKKIKLSDYEAQIKSRICRLWDKTDQDRQSTLDINDEVLNHLTYSDKKDLYGKLPDVLEIAESYIAHIDNSMFKSADGLFSVSNPDMEKVENCLIQKGSLIETIENGKIMDAYIEGSENWILKGEYILFHCWGDDKDYEMFEQEVETEEGSEFAYEKQEITTYEGVKVKAIEPKDFVFDTTKYKSFDKSVCFKIYRDWKTLEELKSEDLYSELLTEDIVNKLEASIKDAEPTTEQDFDTRNNKNTNQVIDGDLIEVLEYWGDITLKNGKVLKDYVITVAAREHIIRFEENRFTKCPWTWHPFYLDLKTRRGLSALVPTIGLNDKGTKIYDAILDALKYANNPAHWVKKGTEVDKSKKIEPGAFIEWDDKTGSNQPPIEIQSWKGIPLNFDNINFIESKIEQVTGMPKYNTGDASGIARTATESQNILSGSNVRLGKKMLDLSNKVILPSVRIIAELNAFFIPNESEEFNKTVNYQDKDGETQQGDLTKDILRDKYIYNIGNSQAIIEQKAKLNELIPIMDGLQARMGIKFKGAEVWNYVAQAMELQKPSQFIESDPLSEVLNQLPPEEQDLIKQQLAQLVQQQIQQRMMNEQAGFEGAPQTTAQAQY